ncbi:hypothetical protein [Bradyrhizobium sp. 76]|uniref:hypothetical protein n=1 Tax=Bradyrhizobium sp. 76 TaxID=2782680 RepID=UPI001FF8CC14|nr:hypothetical protein [Bradyrhizobium sp. 76]MCK1407629.1 hypothetical protein [Bradyrhizobium sp. 76]
MTAAARTDLPAPAVRAAHVILVDEQGAKICSAGIVVANDIFPEVVMFNGDPHICTETLGCYRRVRPYRLDGGL